MNLANPTRRSVFLRVLSVLCCSAVLACVGGSPGALAAAPLAVGDILISVAGTNGHTPGVLRVDPVSGDREFVIGGGVGGGVELLSVAGMSLERNSTLFITDTAHKAVLQVDLASGDRSVVSGLGVGLGAALDRPEALWRESENSLLVLDRNGIAGRILRVDLTTGDRAVVTAPTQGAGPEIVNPGQLITLPGGDILMTIAGSPDDGFTGAVYRVDPITGDRSEFSGPTRGAGTDFITASGITLSPAGEIFVTDNWNARVYRLDPDTGDREFLIDGGNSSHGFLSPYAIAAEASGRLVFTDVNYGEVFRGNPVDGSHVVLSSVAVGVGEGPRIEYSLGIAVVQVPEPRAMVLVFVGICAVTMRAMRLRVSR